MEWRARSAARVAIPETEKFNAPLFRSLVESLETRARWIVLDLGAARTQTIAMFGQYRCRLDIADIADGLEDLNAEQEAASLFATADALLPRPGGEATDVVLCWDILNYLERPALRAVMGQIALRARSGTLVHALIAYSQVNMPTRPGSYVPMGDGSLLDLSVQTGERPAPRYSPDDLKRCLPAYSIERAMLLSNGMQEFLFRV